jgi:DNA-binding MarR family transcriptional regulator
MNDAAGNAGTTRARFQTSLANEGALQPTVDARPDGRVGHELGAVRQLLRAAAALRVYVEAVALRTHQLGWVEFDVLQEVSLRGATTPDVIGAALHLRRPATRWATGRLLERGWIRWRVDVHDSRVASVELTADGRRVAASLAKRVERAETALLRAMGDAASDLVRGSFAPALARLAEAARITTGRTR